MGSGPSAAAHPNEIDVNTLPKRMESRKSLSLAQVYHFRVGDGAGAHTASLFQSLLNAPDPSLFLAQLEGLEKDDKARVALAVGPPPWRRAVVKAGRVPSSTVLLSPQRCIDDVCGRGNSWPASVAGGAVGAPLVALAASSGASLQRTLSTGRVLGAGHRCCGSAG